MTGNCTTQKTPVRMGHLFSQMFLDCPLDILSVQIQVYGKCVADLHGGVSRHMCEQEFQKLRKCWERVMHKRRA